MRRLLLLLAFSSVATGQTYYDKTTIPPKIAANTVLANGTSATAAPQQMAVSSCSASTSALIWTTNTGLGCNTSINAATLGGATFAAPGSIGSGTAAAGAFTTLSASSTVSGTGFSTYLASPPAIGGSTPAAGNFTTLGASGLLTASLGITGSAAAISLNDNSNFNTTINTGTSTGTVTIGQNSSTPSSIVLKGPVSFQAGTAYSGASWAAVSPIWNVTAVTLNDTTASGTVAKDSAYTFQAANFTSTGGASTTITNANTVDIPAPTCSGGVVCSNLNALNVAGRINATGQIIGAAGATINSATINLNVNSNNGTNINTGTSNGAIHIGDGSGNNAITIGNGTGLVNMTNIENAAGTTFTTSNFSGCSVTNGTPGTLTGGSQTGTFVANSHGTTCSVVITMNGATGATAAHGWWCVGTDLTSVVALVQSAKSTTTCTLKGTINADSDTIIFHAIAY